MAWDYGSQYQLQRWVLERPDELNTDLTARNKALASWAQKIEWISPTSETTKELRDDAWNAIGLPEPSPQQAGWWPKGGAVWDAVARVHGSAGEVGGILVEAKGRVGELRSGGCKATAPESIQKISSALADVQASLGATPSPAWMGACYQPANRLAMLWFARCRSTPTVPVWLVSLYFLGENYPAVKAPHVGPTTEAAWRPIIQAVHAEVGLPPAPHELSPWWVESFLPVLEPPAAPGP